MSTRGSGCRVGVLVGLLAVGCGDGGGGGGGREAGAASDAAADAAGDAGDAGPTGTECPTGSCNVVTNEGCNAGQACRLSAPESGAALEPTCSAVGDGGSGQPCNGSDECRAGFMCLNGTCKHLCCGDSDSDCPGEQICATRLTDPNTGEPTGVSACVSTNACDPLTQRGCADGQGCYALNGRSLCRNPNPGSEDKSEGASCEAPSDCPVGMTCVPMHSGNQCLKMCQIGSGARCRDAQNCTAFESRDDGVGVCGPPGAGLDGGVPDGGE